ncbi:MAG TPA: hypothetical protein VMW76_08760 [Bacteroidales bacterium]|nr:hypothetical protein [Bacteroidales bacterium]
MRPIRNILLVLLIIFTLCESVSSQARVAFSGDIQKFSEELTAFMGTNLDEEQRSLLNSFLVAWDSTMLDQHHKEQIISISRLLVAKRMRPVPHFISYLETLMSFINYDVDKEMFMTWLEALSQLSGDPGNPLSEVNKFTETGGLLVREGILYRSSSSIWKTTNRRYSFINDSIFRIIIPPAALICYSQYDSTIIENTRGIYVPAKNRWYGNGGTVTWQKAGISPEEVYASLGRYEVDVTRALFEADSVKFRHHIYFTEPVYGKLSDRAVKITNPESATYPRFETYQKKFFIKDIYKNVDFEGGLSFEGSSVRGTGDNFQPSIITMYRNDTLYVKVKSTSFIFNQQALNSQSTSFTLYLENDSIYHSDIAFTYNVKNREVNTFRSRFPTSRSPYFSSYHMMDMYFEYLSWKLEESKITLSRARGASMGQAFFESVSYFDLNEFHRLMALDEYHPLYRVSKFAEYWYSETFPVDEFARWINIPQENATALCVDLANHGFLFYDRANDEVTIKQKLYDYINSNARQQDYDVMSFTSETSGTLDNAVLDMRNYKMTVNGVPRIFLSDSQRVAIFPYNQRIVLERNRSFEFDGIVQAGMLTIFGHDFKFSYDTFKINLVNVDSMMLAVETDERDEFGGLLARRIEDLIQMTAGELLIDDPNNKSGLQSLRQYPIFSSLEDSYIFYDKIPDLEGVYPKSEFYFKLDPFTFENTDRLTEADLNLTGDFSAGNILPKLPQRLSLQNDKSLGFYYEIPEEGLDLYEGKGRLFNSVTMSNSGLKGHGRVDHLAASAMSEEFNLFPDSMLTIADQFIISATTIYPEVYTENAVIKWYPAQDKWYAEQAGGDEFRMFDNGTLLDGNLLLTSESLKGSGVINLTDSQIDSESFNFGGLTIQADTSEYNLKSVSGDGYAFIAEDANTLIDFENHLSRFRLNTDSSLVKFPEVDYICTMTDFEYNMNSKILSMSQRGREESTLMSPEELLKQDISNTEKPTFFSTHMMNDTITFAATTGHYLLQDEMVIAENVNYIKIADALIQPDSGILRINKGARMDAITDAIIAINKNHIIHSASVNIIGSTRYTASGIYDWVDENNEIQIIKFDEIVTDSLRSKGTGRITQVQNFKLSPYFTFIGDVHLRSEKKQLSFLGSSGIVHECDAIGSAPMRFNADIDPLNVMIPISDKPRDVNGNLITLGTYITIDSTHIYSAFLSPAKSWSDIPLVTARGWIIYDKIAGKYKVAEKEKLANSTIGGSMITFDRNYCIVYSEGPENLGLDYGLVKMTGAGNVTHITDSAAININSILALDFHFSQPALTVMADEIRFMATLRPVDLSTGRYDKGMQDLIGAQAAATLKEEMDLFGMTTTFPRGFAPELILNDLNLTWNDEFRSYRSVGKIGIGFIGQQAVNLYVDGFVELQKRRSGDILDIYLKADDQTWFWFSYTRGVLMALAGNNSFNTIIQGEKLNDRKHPDNSIRTPYTYMVGVQDRLDNFLRRMTRAEEPDEFVEDFLP